VFGFCSNVESSQTAGADESQPSLQARTTVIPKYRNQLFVMFRLAQAGVDTSVATVTFSQTGANWKATGLPQTATVQFPYSFMFFRSAFGTIQIVSSFTMRNE